MRAKYNRILIVRTDRIGDVLLSTPVIQAVRQYNPKGYIAFMARPYTKDIVIGNPYLDEVIIYDKEILQGSILALAAFVLRLKRYRFDLALMLHSTVRTNLIVFLVGIPRRVGYQIKAGWCLTDKLAYVKSLGLKHEVEYTMDVARAAGIPCDSRHLKPYLPVSAGCEDFAADFLKKNSIGQKDVLVGIHPSASCPSRRWPVERFAAVADAIIEKAGYKVLILAAGDDLKAANMVKDKMKHAPALAVGLTIPQTAAILKRCRFFISTDTGPAHIASAMGTPCITIFGRKQPGLGPVRWMPQGDRVIVLHKDAGCTECLAHKCKKRFACLEAITVDEVLCAAKEFLQKSRINPRQYLKSNF